MNSEHDRVGRNEVVDGIGSTMSALKEGQEKELEDKILALQISKWRALFSENLKVGGRSWNVLHFSTCDCGELFP